MISTYSISINTLCEQILIKQDLFKKQNMLHLN